ncbi:MAG: WbqC family protein, partial [Bacteroidia bacterium]|nr:WbqC family protein [Bacteroidia bacterium]
MIEPQYLPPAPYFAAALWYGTLILEKHEHYRKQTLRNRALINTAHGTERLVVPVKSGKVPMGE